MVVAAFAVLPLLVGASASAQQATCAVGYTGPDSNNLCTMTYNCSVTETNTNTVTITDKTGQQAASGSVTVSGNGTAGNSTSGTVTNSNGTVFNVTITNSSPENETPALCTATVTATATPPPTTTPTPQSSGGGEVLGATSASVKPATLPDTSADISSIVVGSVLLVIALSVSSVVWYRARKML